MNSYILLLSELLDKRYLADPQQYCIEKNGQVDMRIRIEAKGKNGKIPYLLYKFEPLEQPQAKKGEKETKLIPFFSKVKGAQSCCDYLLFAEQGGQLHVLVIELKKGRESVTAQIAAGIGLMEYIVATLNRVYDLNITPAIYRISIRGSKQRNNAKKQILSPVNGLYTLKGEKLYINQLIQNIE